MEIKRILKFYFGADSLEERLNRLMFKSAVSSAGNVANCGECAEKIIELICEKAELAKFWIYLNGVLSLMRVEDLAALERYAFMRCGIRSIDERGRREIRRAAIKFRRRARRLESFKEGIALADKYVNFLVR